MVIELFAGEDLQGSLEQSLRALALHIARLNSDFILSTPEQDIVEQLVREASADCPHLLVDKVEMREPVEYTEDVGLYGDGHPISHEVPRWTFVVPFTGNGRIFRARASHRAASRPVALNVGENELELFVDGRLDHQTIRRSFDTQVESIQRHLEWSRADIEEHNARLRADVSGMVRDRREQVQVMRDTQAQIGFPIRHRGDPKTTPVPLITRSVRPTRRTAKAGSLATQQYVLEDGDYEEALRVLRYWRDSLERAPSIADKRGEEEIRDLLVAGLNSVFKGVAASEVFNGDGKTDILIRVGGGNVFVGECKIWDGEASMNEALDQIFRYAVWRDTKTAILLFIRNRDVAAVIEKAMTRIEEHSNFKRKSHATSASDHNFVMHAGGDPQREIRLAFIPFALRAKGDRLRRS
jgi:hypothetical protein